MWLEIKGAFTGAACIITMLVMWFATSVTQNLIFLIVAIVPVMIMIAGDIIIGWKAISTDAINLLDPNGLGERTILLHLIGSGFRVLKGKKAPLGKIEFVYGKKKASIIDDGSYPVRLPNGNAGVVAHESYDRNVDLYKAELLKKMFIAHKVDNIKELYNSIKQEENNGRKPTPEVTTTS